MPYPLLLAFIVYFGTLFAISIIHLAKTKTSSDFIIGNRSVNYWITAIAAHASDMSAWLFMGFPAAIYTNGLTGSWIAIGLIGGMFFSWHFIAHALRIKTEEYNVLTLSSFLEKRFSDSSGLLRICSSLLTIIFFAFYIAAGLTGMGYVFEAVFHINYYSGMIIGLAISLLYIMIGGFIAIAWNHFFQGIFLLVMIIIVPLYGLYNLGSIAPIFANAGAKNISLSLIPSFSQETFIYILNGIMWGVGYLGMPHIIVNFMGINDPNYIKHAKYLGMSWQIISLLCAIGVGFVGIGYFITLNNNELIFVELVQQLFHPLFTGFILCAILAATMSTIDTQILVSSSALTEDIYKKIFHHNASEKQLLWVSRVSILIIALISFILAAQKNATVMGLVSYAWSGLASSFSPVITAALYSKSVNKWGVFASMLTGAIVAGLWPLTHSPILSLIPGTIASTIALFGISKITK